MNLGTNLGMNPKYNFIEQEIRCCRRNLMARKKLDLPLPFQQYSEQKGWRLRWNVEAEMFTRKRKAVFFQNLKRWNNLVHRPIPSTFFKWTMTLWYLMQFMPPDWGHSVRGCCNTLVFLRVIFWSESLRMMVILWVHGADTQLNHLFIQKKGSITTEHLESKYYNSLKAYLWKTRYAKQYTI